MHDLSRAGNTVLVIEHDEKVVRSADRVLELGPGAGKDGGRIVFDGTPEALAQRIDTPTGKAWAASRRGAAPSDHGVSRPSASSCAGRAQTTSTYRGAHPARCRVRHHGTERLGQVDARRRHPLPEPRPHLRRHVGRPSRAHTAIDGAGSLGRVVLVDQSPLGRTARGNAATYTKAWNRIRTLFADEPERNAAGSPRRTSRSTSPRPRGARRTARRAPDDARRAQAKATRPSRCSSWRTCLFSARSVRGSASGPRSSP